MDQHPIPQNVTGFQFKLIGSMTVKQFGYIAVGVIAAAITYYIPIHGIFAVFLKILLIPFFGAVGPIFAFIPIDGRPIDVMAGNFMKALFSPNQYIYRKGNKQFSFSTISLSRPHTNVQTGQDAHATPKQKMVNERGRELQKLLIKGSEHKIKNAQDVREAAFLNSILQSSPAVSAPPPSSPAAQNPILPEKPPVPIKAENKPSPVPPAANPTPEMLSEKEAVLKKQLEFAAQQEAIVKSPNDTASAHQKTLELEKQVAEIHNQKQLLEQEITQLKNQLLAQQAPAVPIAKKDVAKTPPPNQTTPHVRSVPKDMNKSLGLFMPDTPNVVSGMVKDSRGNVLPNILVEIKDKSGNPVRAFKTNSLGNFASATPLPAGTFTITLEDLKKQHTFDSIQITTNDQIMLPIEITSYDKREELRKDLFS